MVSMRRWLYFHEPHAQASEMSAYSALMSVINLAATENINTPL